MKKLIALTAIAALMSGVSFSTFAAGKSAEEMCKHKAEKQHVSEDKMDAFVKTCVEKHNEHHTAKHKAAHTGGTAAHAAPETPTAPAK